MRRFRAIIESITEPEDKEVLWYHDRSLYYYNKKAWELFIPFFSQNVEYFTKEDEDISSVKEALDKLMYVNPKITAFNLQQAGTYEKGTVIRSLVFSWSYNKKNIISQSIDSTNIPISFRSYQINREIKTDTTFTLHAYDGTNTTSSSVVIKFVEYMYYGVIKGNNQINKGKFNPSIKSLSVIANTNEYIWIFIPNSAKLTKIWHNNADSTDDFTSTDFVFTSDTKQNINGKYYISKKHSLNDVTLKFT